MKSSKIITLLLLLKAISCNSQTIIGTITDQSNIPLKYANIILLNKDSIFVKGSVSDSIGNFKISIDTGSYLLKISYMGFYNRWRPIDLRHKGNKNIGTFILEPDSKKINDIVVHANYMFLSPEGIKIDVALSPLKDERNITEVLCKIPGMTVNDNIPITFAQGAPVFYVNDKKVHNFREIMNIPVKEIESVELITHPGAEYNAEEHTILKITTKHPENGLSLFVMGNGDIGQTISQNEGINFNYQHNNLNFFGNYLFDNSHARNKGFSKTEVSNADTLRNYRKDEKYTINYYLHVLSGGVNWDINPNHSVGVEYTGSFVPTLNLPISGTQTMKINNIEKDRINLKTQTKMKNDEHHVNLFYKGKWGKKWNFNYFGDYVKSLYTNNMNVTESHQKEDEKTKTYTHMDYSLYSMTGKFIYLMKPKNLFTVGGDFHWITGNSLQTLNGNNRLTDNHNQEKLRAAYLVYSLQKKNFDLTVGLRYEHVSMAFRKHLGQNNDSQTYDNLFPNISLNYRVGGFDHSLSYNMKTVRPSFDDLANNLYYNNQYNYTVGNPSLIPQISHNLSYSLRYKNLYLTTQYSNIHHYISTAYYQNNTKPDIIIMTKQNYNHFQQLNVTANYQHSLGFWSSDITVNFKKNFFSQIYLGTKITDNDPEINIDWNNAFNLLFHWTLNLEYNFISYHNELIYTYWQKHLVNISLSHSFLKDKSFMLTIFANDLFHNDRTKEVYRIGNVKNYLLEHSDSRRFGISFVWFFNNYRKHYKGTSSVEEDINRFKK